MRHPCLETAHNVRRVVNPAEEIVLIHLWSKRFSDGIKKILVWFQQFARVTSRGSLPPRNLGKLHGPPQSPAEPSERPRRAL